MSHARFFKIGALLVCAAMVPRGLVGAATSSRGSAVRATKSVRVEKPQMKAVNQPLVRQLKENLQKNEKSILLTKEKIRSAKEIQFLPDLHLMLAELIIEKSRIQYALKLEEKPNVSREELDLTAEKRTKAEAIEVLKSIEDRYPNFAALDSVIFAIAHEYREMADDDRALQTYKRLTEKFQQSRFWDEAQYNIGNIYYDKKDFEFALEQYSKILPRPQGTMTMMAYYKIGLCHMQLDKSLLAVQDFEKVLATQVEVDVDKLPQDFKRRDVREEALIASVKPLSDLAPEELRTNPAYADPLSYYKKLSPNRTAYLNLLARLGKRMSVKERHYEAARAHWEMFSYSEDLTQKKEALESYYFAMKKAKRDDHKDSAAREIAEFLWRLRDEGKAKEYFRYEPVLRDVVTVTHKVALKTKRPEDLDRAIESYKDYLWIYPTSKYRRDIVLNMAESAFHAKRLVEAGLRYQSLLATAKTSKEQKELYTSAFESLGSAFKDQENGLLINKIQGRYAYAKMAEEFALKYKNDPALPSLAFNLGKSLYDSQDYEGAALRLRTYLTKYPSHKDAGAAAMLYLDCFYVRDDLKRLVLEGQRILKLPLQASVKQEVRQTMQQSQLKRVRSLAGEFATKSYADQFIKFAKQSGKSSLGETALYEAFISLKVSQDPQAFTVGDQYLGQYGQTAKAKSVLSELIQLALATSDYDKTAQYLMAFAQMYPQDESSSKFALSAGQIYEGLGDSSRAAKVFMAQNQPDRAAEILFKAQLWQELLPVAAKVPGSKGLYYQGMAHYRLGQREDGLQLLSRVFNSGAHDDSEKRMAAHAGYLLAEREFANYQQVARDGVTAPDTIKKKAAALAEVDKVILKTIDLAVGKWVIAALHLEGQLYRDFSAFLKRGPAPKPLSQAQYMQLVAPQIAGYDKNAEEVFAKCASGGEQYNVFSNFVVGCKSRGVARIDEAKEDRVIQRSIASRGERSERARRALIKDPQNATLVSDLANAYFQENNFPQARTLYGRVLELKPNDAQAQAQIGLIHFKLQAWDDAFSYFETALKSDAENNVARWGLVALYRRFGYQQKMNQSLARAKATGSEPAALATGRLEL